MKNGIIASMLLAAFCFGTAISQAQEKGAKKSPSDTMVAQFLKQLEKASLTAEQTTKVKEVYGKVATEVAKKRTDAGITADMMKKRNEARKAATEAGKKGKDAQAAVDASVALTEDQKKVLTETDSQLNKAAIEVGKLLTPEQMAKLPEQAQARLKERPAGKKGKK